MKKLLCLFLCVILSKISSAQQNYPVKLSTNGTQKLELIIVGDGGIVNGNGSCIIQVGQDEEMLLHHILRFKPHASMMKSINLISGDAEIFIKCDTMSVVYFNVLAITTNGEESNSTYINDKLFMTSSYGPFDFTQGFYKKLVIE